MSVEEGRRLLSNQALDGESEDEDVVFASFVSSNGVLRSSSAGRASPPPSYCSPQPATLVLTENSTRRVGSGLTELSEPLVLGGAVGSSEAPPDYTLHASKSDDYPVKKAGMAVHIQIDGQLVPGTVMEDASGRHMVYICQPQAPSSTLPDSMEKPRCPNDYIFLSLISLLCCCAPLGVFALIKSLEVQRLYKRGDYLGALRASKQAYSWGSAAVVFGTTLIIMVFALKVYFSSEFNHDSYYYY